jgi:GAF domain-containing protein
LAAARLGTHPPQAQPRSRSPPGGRARRRCPCRSTASPSHGSCGSCSRARTARPGRAWPPPSSGSPRPPPPSCGPGRGLATAQERLGAGPALDSYASELPVASRDVTADARWPDLRHLVDRTKVRAVLSAPLTLPGDGPIGALNLHSATARDWDLADIGATVAYAGVVASLISMALEARLRGALLDKLLDALRATTDRPDPEDG